MSILDCGIPVETKYIMEEFVGLTDIWPLIALFLLRELCELRELRERHDAEQRALEAQHVSMHAGKLSVTTEEQSGDLALVEHESSELP